MVVSTSKFLIGTIHITILVIDIGTIIYVNNRPIAKLNNQQKNALKVAIDCLKQMRDVDFKEFISKRGKVGKYELIVKDQDGNTFEKTIIFIDDMIMICDS